MINSQYDVSVFVIRFLNSSKKFLVRYWANSSSDPQQDGRFEVPTVEYANVVSSHVDGSNGLHRPVLDLDIPAELVASSTPGHSHLYIDHLLTWENYQKLLDALVEAGIIEHGFVATSKKRGSTMVRLPWVHK